MGIECEGECQGGPITAIVAKLHRLAPPIRSLGPFYSPVEPVHHSTSLEWLLWRQTSPLYLRYNARPTSHIVRVWMMLYPARPTDSRPAASTLIPLFLHQLDLCLLQIDGTGHFLGLDTTNCLAPFFSFLFLVLLPMSPTRWFLRVGQYILGGVMGVVFELFVLSESPDRRGSGCF